MNKYGFALVGAVSLALAGCGGSADDSLNNVEAYDNSAVNLDAANEAANNAEAEALGNQQLQLEQENAAAVDELNAADSTEGEENVSGM